MATTRVLCSFRDMVGATKNSTSRDVNTIPFQAQLLTAPHDGPATYRKSILSATCSGAMALDHTALHCRAWNAGWRICEASRTGWHPILCRMCVRPEDKVNSTCASKETDSGMRNRTKFANSTTSLVHWSCRTYWQQYRVKFITYLCVM